MRLRAWLGTLAASERTVTANRQLGIILAFVAGAVNAGGFIVIDRYTSHMTGIVSSIATSLTLDEHPLVFTAIAFVASFIAGSMASAIFINIARTRYPHSEFALALMAEALLLFIFALAASHVLPLKGNFVSFTAALLCFIMGLQNAITTKLSRSEVRTTHVTGICTDIGIKLGRLVYKKSGGRENVLFQRDKLLFNSRMLGSFLFGGIIGAEAFTHIGFVSIVPLSFVLVTIAVAPLAHPKTPEA